ncbi:endonuclease/exonuclease/phosphatase family metal-dependent hydrolase [Nitrobacteraceae bacterium AZCC 2161]
MTLLSAHLCPNAPIVRRREAAHLAVQAPPETLALLTGDFNSASPHDPEPEGLETLPTHHRTRYLADDLKRADRSVLAHLEFAGWVAVGHVLGNAATSTVPTAGFTGTEFAVVRCDYVLATAALAAGAATYGVIRTPATDMASDHYPIVATFKVPPRESGALSCGC